LAQEKNIYIEYIDKQIYRKETTAFLIANSQYAVYEERQSKEKAKKEVSEGSMGNVVALILDVKPNKFYKTKDSQIIYYEEHIVKEETAYPVYDSIPKLNWEFVEGTEYISGYICNKAKVRFRGTNLTAYYTTEIPVPFGPWKFDGLPGVILKISDDQNSDKIYWEASKIIYPYNKKVDFDFDKNDYTMSLKEFKFKSFRVYQERIPDNTPMNAAQRMKYGKRNFIVEKVYEWEKAGDVWRIYYMDYFQKIPPW